jgi:hypothetical protein
VKFGNAKQGRNVGRLQSLGVAHIRGYVDTFDEVFEFDAHVIPGSDTLFSLDGPEWVVKPRCVSSSCSLLLREAGRYSARLLRLCTVTAFIH